MRHYLPLLVALSACRPSASPVAPTAPPSAPSRQSLAIDGDPNGLWWSDGQLLVADDDHNRILVWSGSGPFTTLAELPAGSGHVGLGGLVRLPDGTIVVARLGDVGDVVMIRPGEAPTVIAGLDPRRRRIGLAASPDSRLFATWYVRHGDAREGGIAELNLAGGERDLVGGLQKPVGLAVVDGALVASDQFGKRVVRVTLGDPPALVDLATGIDGPDLITTLADGTVLTGDASGYVLAIDRRGLVRQLAGGFRRIRGIAVDESGGRLFVADHGGDGDAPRIELVPLP